MQQSTMLKKFLLMPNRIRSFYLFIRYHALNTIGTAFPSTIGIGKYHLGNIANIDQIPLEFEFLTGGTYEIKGATTVQV